MRNLPVAYGNSCFAKTWPNKTILFDELCARLEQTIRTTESIEEYQKMPKAERDRIKDKGGFVGGQLRDNRRKRENVTCRSMLTLDCDHGLTVTTAHVILCWDDRFEITSVEDVKGRAMYL